VSVTNALMITSLLAAIISFNNATVRYWFALGRDRVAWHRLETLHPKQKTAYIAANLQTILMVSCTLLFAVFQLDPQETLVPYLSVPSAVGLVAVQALTALAVIFFFKADRRGVSLWRRLVAPLLSFVGFMYFIYAMIVHVDLMVGKDSTFVHVLPWCTLVTAVLGVIFAYWLKHRRPVVYENLNNFLSDI
jgi:amino acid transporter